MKLFTKEIDKKLFEQYLLGSDLESQVVVAKIFNPYGRGTWYLLNSDPEDPEYLWAIVDMDEIEVGSVNRSDLENIRIKPFMLGLERDLSFSPINAAELFRGLHEGKTYAKGGGVGDIYTGTPSGDYEDDSDLYHPIKSYVIDNKTNKIVSVHDTPKQAIMHRNKTNPNHLVHFDLTKMAKGGYVPIPMGLKITGTYKFVAADGTEYNFKVAGTERKNDTEDLLILMTNYDDNSIKEKLRGIVVKNNAIRRVAKGETVVAHAGVGSSIKGKLTKTDVFETGGTSESNGFYVKSNFGHWSVIDKETNKMVVGYSSKAQANKTAEGLNNIKDPNKLQETISHLKTTQGYGHFNRMSTGGPTTGEYDFLVGKWVELSVLGSEESEHYKIISVRVSPEKFDNRELSISLGQGTEEKMPLSKAKDFIAGKEVKLTDSQGEPYILQLRDMKETGGPVEKEPINLEAGQNYTEQVLMKTGGAIKPCPAGTKVQTLLFDIDVFKNHYKAQTWAKQHGFKPGKKLDKAENNIRIRQAAPSHFKYNTFKTIDLTEGVKAVVACPKK